MNIKNLLIHQTLMILILAHIKELLLISIKSDFILNSHSYPICENWLLKLMKYSNEKTLIATSASNESILDSIKLKNFIKLLLIY